MIQARAVKSMIELYRREPDPAGGRSDHVTIEQLSVEAAYRLIADIQAALPSALEAATVAHKETIAKAEQELTAAQQRLEAAQARLVGSLHFINFGTTALVQAEKSECARTALLPVGPGHQLAQRCSRDRGRRQGSHAAADRRMGLCP